MKQVEVECDAVLGDREIPRRFHMGGRSIEVIELIDYWPSQDHHYYKVRSEDECVFILRYDIIAEIWEVTMFERRDYQGNNEAQVFHHNFRGKV